MKGDLPFPQKEYPVRDEEDIGDVMTDENSGKSELFSVMGDHAQDDVFPDRVLAGRRLVKEHDGRVCYKCPGQGHTFLHAA